MKKFFKEFLEAQALRANSTRGTLIAVVGGYVVYLGYQIIRDARSGASSMNMAVCIITAIFFALAGLAIFALGGYIFWTGWKKEQKSQNNDNENNNNNEDNEEEEDKP